MVREPGCALTACAVGPDVTAVDPFSRSRHGAEPTTRINSYDAWMACLRSRLIAGNRRWLHACHCCDSGAPSAPWGAWSWPGTRPLSTDQESEPARPALRCQGRPSWKTAI